MSKPTIGLFGTCGSSTWRKDFIEEYKSLGINYYNPQIEQWDETCAAIEAEHLVNDEIVLFPVTSETYGTGSLGETGFSIIQAINSNRSRFVVIMIDKVLDESLKDNGLAYKESTRARALVLAHLNKINYENVYIVSNMQELLQVSIKLYQISEKLNELKQFSSLKG